MFYSLKWLFFILQPFIICSIVFGQEEIPCQRAHHLIYDLTGNIVPLTQQSYFNQNTRGDFILYDQNEVGSSSHWYKIDFYQDATLELSIKSEDNFSIFNFFIYQDTAKNQSFCKGIENKEILPIRTNLLKSDTGGLQVGLAKSTQTEEADTQYIYHTAFHKPLEAPSRSSFYINVYRTQGNACAHQLTLSINNSSKGFCKTTKTCLQDSIYQTPAFIPITDHRIAQIIQKKEKTFTNTLIIQGTIKDSLSQKSIYADIQCINNSLDTHNTSTGEFMIFLNGFIFYDVEISSIGYRNKKIKLMKQTQQAELRSLGDIYLEPLKTGDHFIMKNLYFHAGTYAIKDGSNETLAKLVDFMLNNPQAIIEIQGHTNGKGKVKKRADQTHLGPEWNFKGNEKKLSFFRAQAIKNYLIKEGIDEARITCKGFGSQKMLYPKPKNKEQNDLNKRVEIVLLKNN